MMIAQSPAEASTRETYLALMWSLSYPGRAHALPAGGDDFMQIGRTLLDLETSFFCADEMLADRLLQTSAHVKPIHEAAYVFMPQLSGVEFLRQLNLGTFAYPDTGATLITGCDFDAGDASITTWEGPGIASPRRVLLGNVPPAFWSLRSELIQYPLGLDVFFVSKGCVMGLPRTTTVTSF